LIAQEGNEGDLQHQDSKAIVERVEVIEDSKKGNHDGKQTRSRKKEH
jgi:hypothetical protein